MLDKEFRPLSTTNNDFVDNVSTWMRIEYVNLKSEKNMCLPLLNSSVVIICVEYVTLCVAHIAGYVGVMMGILCERSAGYNCHSL